MAGRGRSGHGRKATIDLGAILGTLYDIYGDSVTPVTEGPAKDVQGPNEGTGEGTKGPTRTKFKANNFFARPRASQLNTDLAAKESFARTTNDLDLAKTIILRDDEQVRESVKSFGRVAEQAELEAIKRFGLPLAKLTPQVQELLKQNAVKDLQLAGIKAETAGEDEINKGIAFRAKRPRLGTEVQSEQDANIATKELTATGATQESKFLGENPSYIEDTRLADLRGKQISTRFTEAGIPKAGFMDLGGMAFKPSTGERIEAPYFDEEAIYEQLPGSPIRSYKGNIRKRIPFRQYKPQSEMRGYYEETPSSETITPQPVTPPIQSNFNILDMIQELLSKSPKRY